MIVGETLAARRSETATTPFALPASSVTLAVTQPDGAIVNPTVTVTPETSAAAHDLQGVFAAPVGGQYRLRWRVPIGASVFVRLDSYLATYTDASGYAKIRLAETGSDMTDEQFDRTAAYMIEELQTRFPALAYASLSSDMDKDLFDKALALMSAAALYPSLRPGGLNGPEQQRTEGDVSVRWQQPRQSLSTAANGKQALGFMTERDKWSAEALESLARVSVIRASQNAILNSLNPFSISGPSKTARSKGLTYGLGGELRGIIDAFPTFAAGFPELFVGGKP
jgi:hypothetical protein